MNSSPTPALPDSPATPSWPPLSGDMSAEQAGRAVVAHYLERVVAKEAGTIAGQDPEALHDMRVATRRLRAAFRAFRPVLSPEQTATLNDETRWLALLLGHVRDLDVFLVWLAAYAEERPDEEGPALARLSEAVRQQREGPRHALLEGLQSLRYTALKQALADFAAVPAAGADEPVGATAYARRAIRRQMRATRRRGKAATAADIDSLHLLRIAAKRLRYVCEFFAPLFPGQLEPTIAAATAVQDALGAMRDAELQRRRVLALLDEAGEGDEDYTRALARVARALRRRARCQLAAYETAYPRLMKRKARRRLKRALARGAAG